MNQFTYAQLATKVVFGAGMRSRVADEVDALGCERVMLIGTGSPVAVADEAAVVATLGWRLVAHWTEVVQHVPAGLRHVLCTDVGCDGALSGPNFDLYVEATHRFPAIDWQASGGVRDARDLWALAGGGVAAAISGRALLENRIPPEELKPFLPAA